MLRAKSFDRTKSSTLFAIALCRLKVIYIKRFQTQTTFFPVLYYCALFGIFATSFLFLTSKSDVGKLSFSVFKHSRFTILVSLNDSDRQVLAIQNW